MKQVDLNSIFDYHLLALETLDEHSRDLVIKAMREACNQTVDLCAENAKWVYRGDIFIDKQSILKTKKQII